jgi:hypothetical protein
VKICLRLQIPDSDRDSSETGKKQALLKCVCPSSVLVSCEDLSTTTHSRQYRSFNRDRRETSANEVCVSSFSNPGWAIPPSTLSSWHIV